MKTAAAIAALLAALFALNGKTTNEGSEHPLKRLNKTGWALLLVALAAFGVQLFQNRIDRYEEDAKQLSAALLSQQPIKDILSARTDINKLQELTEANHKQLAVIIETIQIPASIPAPETKQTPQ